MMQGILGDDPNMPNSDFSLQSPCLGIRELYVCVHELVCIQEPPCLCERCMHACIVEVMNCWPFCFDILKSTNVLILVFCEHSDHHVGCDFIGTKSAQVCIS